MAGKKRRMMSDINVVPYIDVMLVLLIIFMVTAPMLSQGVKVDLPQASATPIEPDNREPLVVSIDASGSYYLSLGSDPQAPLEADMLLQQLADAREREPGIPVYVKGDRHVAYGRVVEVMVLIQQSGVESVGLMTESPEYSDGR